MLGVINQKMDENPAVNSTCHIIVDVYYIVFLLWFFKFSKSNQRRPRTRKTTVSTIQHLPLPGAPWRFSLLCHGPLLQPSLSTLWLQTTAFSHGGLGSVGVVCFETLGFLNDFLFFFLFFCGFLSYFLVLIETLLYQDSHGFVFTLLGIF